MNRRDFLKTLGAMAAATAVPVVAPRALELAALPDRGFRPIQFGPFTQPREIGLSLSLRAPQGMKLAFVGFTDADAYVEPWVLTLHPDRWQEVRFRGPRVRGGSIRMLTPGAVAFDGELYAPGCGTVLVRNVTVTSVREDANAIGLLLGSDGDYPPSEPMTIRDCQFSF